ELGGKCLVIRRAPMFLRVVRNRKGEFDALDQLKDAPALDEEIFVSRLIKQDGHVCIDGTKNGKRWGCCAVIASYRLADEQPDDATARSYAAWPKWCEAQYEKVKAAIEERAKKRAESPVERG